MRDDGTQSRALGVGLIKNFLCDPVPIMTFLPLYLLIMMMTTVAFENGRCKDFSDYKLDPIMETGLFLASGSFSAYDI